MQIILLVIPKNEAEYERLCFAWTYTKYMAAPKTIVQPTSSETNTIRDVKYTISSLPHIRS